MAVLLVLGHESPLRGPIDQLWEDEELAGDALVQAHGLKEQADQPVERSPRSQQDGSEEQAGRGCEQGLESSISGFGVEVVVGPGPRGLAVELEAKRLPQQGKLREALNDRVRAQAQAKHQVSAVKVLIEQPKPLLCFGRVLSMNEAWEKDPRQSPFFSNLGRFCSENVISSLALCNRCPHVA